MLYELLPLLRGWKPDRHSETASTVTKGQPAKIILHESASPGWLENISFYSSDASCRMRVIRDQEFYNIWHLGYFELPVPHPYHSLDIEVFLSTQSSQNQALYDVTINRIVIPERTEFILSVREVLYGKLGRLFDFHDYELLLELLDKTLKDKGVKAPKESTKEEVLPSMQRYRK